MKRTPIHRISKKRVAVVKREEKIKKVLLERCEGLCMKCHQLPDWRGLSLSHKEPKRMGGTTHEYQIDELELICGKCHSKEHGIVE